MRAAWLVALVGWGCSSTVTVHAPPGTRVVFQDPDSRIVVDGNAGTDGSVTANVSDGGSVTAFASDAPATTAHARFTWLDVHGGDELQLETSPHASASVHVIPPAGSTPGLWLFAGACSGTVDAGTGMATLYGAEPCTGDRPAILRTGCSGSTCTGPDSYLPHANVRDRATLEFTSASPPRAVTFQLMTSGTACAVRVNTSEGATMSSGASQAPISPWTVMVPDIPDVELAVTCTGGEPSTNCLVTGAQAKLAGDEAFSVPPPSNTGVTGVSVDAERRSIDWTWSGGDVATVRVNLGSSNDNWYIAAPASHDGIVLPALDDPDGRIPTTPISIELIDTPGGWDALRPRVFAPAHVEHCGGGEGSAPCILAPDLPLDQLGDALWVRC